MERRIAKYLQGSRTPMSGAAAKYKGDVTVDFINSPGKYIIECKLSDAKDNAGSVLILKLPWFAKIQQEALAMRAKFGVLIIHFHNKPQDFVFIRHDHFNWLMTRSKHTDVMQHIMQHWIMFAPTDIMRFADGKLRATYRFVYNNLMKQQYDYGGWKSGAVNTPDGTYYIIELEQFRDLIEDV